MFQRTSVSAAREHTSVSSNDDDIEIEADPKVLRRTSEVESHLTDFFYGPAATANTYVLPEIKVPKVLPIYRAHAYPCQDTFSRLPVPPCRWSQAPVMMRPTVCSETKIRGIRYVGSESYQDFKGLCAGCQLPINTGREKPGKSLVIDFESPHFVGSLLMRIRDIPPVNDASDYTEDGTSYFDGKRRKFQATVKGKFKTPLNMSECMTGQVFERPAGELPARFVVKAAIKFISLLAPQLEATLDGTQPRFLSPLISTAQTAIAKERRTGASDSQTVAVGATADKEEQLRNYKIYSGALDMEDEVEEPSAADPTSLLQAVPQASNYDSSHKSVSARTKMRKTVFNHLAATKAIEPAFDLEKEYTFEFFQHLLIFDEQDELKVDMGRIIGKVGLAKPLNGQPLKFMGAHKHPETSKLTSLWSFDLWHSSLYGYAQADLDNQTK
jgi:hypothetical protein